MVVWVVLTCVVEPLTIRFPETVRFCARETAPVPSVMVIAVVPSFAFRFVA